MISNYEQLKNAILKNNFKGLKSISSEFYTCRNIEVQKKIIVLLLKHVKKNTLGRHKILNEFNCDLLQINNNRLKEGVHDLLYKINNQSEEKRGSLNTGIVCMKWDSLDYDEVHINTLHGYIFIDSEHLAFYSPKENFVIDLNSIKCVHKNDLNFILELKNDKKLLFRLAEENLNFIDQMKNKMKVIEEPERLQNSPIKYEILKRTSLNNEKLEFHSQIVNNFGKNLSIKIKTPKKDKFYETVFEEEIENEKSVKDYEKANCIKKERKEITNKLPSLIEVRKRLRKIEKEKFKNLKKEFKKKRIQIKQRKRNLISFIENFFKIFKLKHVSTPLKFLNFNFFMRFFRKKLFKKLSDFKFSKTPYLISEETINEYNCTKKLFLISIEILESYKEDDVSSSLPSLKQLLIFYEKIDTLILSLVNEMFKTRFVETIEKRMALFETLNKLLRMFYLFDKYRKNSVGVFHAFSLLKLKNRNKLEERDVLKYSTFSCLAMPMARLFMSYFTADGYEVYHPVILKKRTTMFLTDTKKDYLLFINSVIVDHTNLKYVKLFLCSLYEKVYRDDPFRTAFESLNENEQDYYCDILSLT